MLVMVCAHSRFIMARMIPSRMTGDLLAGLWELIGSLGPVPRRLIWDNETGTGRRNSCAAGVAALAGVLVTRIVQVKPYDPESKGVVGRANQFPGFGKNCGDPKSREASHFRCHLGRQRTVLVPEYCPAAHLFVGRLAESGAASVAFQGWPNPTKLRSWDQRARANPGTSTPLIQLDRA
ncbi:transposase family protein [Arthrobacter sp. NPDC058130]|uniref:integrase catalytic domain-containing protein n=1 Tax=Arthrobacter sp. NPDC058130 TaxID=3346353 RepID=UPI0036EAD2D3